MSEGWWIRTAPTPGSARILTSQLTLTPGTRLGVYDIIAPIGEGGMGQVYRATDRTLGRQVAIKILPDAFAQDPESLARFEREAKTLAALNHPHIAAIYGFEKSAGAQALVMELVEGEDLSQRIAGRGIPIDQALPIAKQIAEALEAAHAQGIIHRDLKPDNVKITADGRVKVLDFGLAKVHVTAGGRRDQSNGPTLMATRPGLILGTFAYMAPEQARGEEADQASDMWAFGCVLFEMLSGRRAFEGATMSEVLANVLRTQPDWDRLPAETPEGVRRLLRRSLQKDQRLRFRDMRDARLEIDEIHEPVERAGTGARFGRGERIAWASALTLVTVIAGVFGVQALRPAPIPAEVHLEINAPPIRDASLALSPDGVKLVYIAPFEGRSHLWLRSLDSPLARPLRGTEGASGQFWSPDSRSVGFVAGTRLKRMDIDGGSVQTLTAAVPVALGATWNRDGTIVFANNPSGPLFRISAQGGEPTEATRVESPKQRGHESPQFLPDGRHFLFFVTGSPEARGVYVGQLDGNDTKRLFDAETPAAYAATGQLIFVREGKLLAQDFDLDQMELRGDASPLAESVTAATSVSVSAAGPIAYRTPPADGGQRQLVWVDRSGRETDKVVYANGAGLGGSLSHDGRRVAVYQLADANMDIWSYDVRRRSWERITFDAGDDIYPLWSPDDARMVSGSVRSTGVVDLYVRLLGDPTASEQRLYSTSQPKFPTDWSADGRFVIYDSLDSKRGFDVWALPMEGERKPFEVVRTEFNEGLAQFSPDTTWIAYQSDKTGRFEIYLRPFRGPGDDVRVSVDGGTQVRWNSNGKELFYLAAGNRLTAVTLRFSANNRGVEPGTPVALFVAKVGGFAGYTQQYMVSRDGQSFVTQSVVGDASASPISVILNWQAKVKK
jgi:Tol biopolymer transport system component